MRKRKDLVFLHTTAVHEAGHAVAQGAGDLRKAMANTTALTATTWPMGCAPPSCRSRLCNAGGAHHYRDPALLALAAPAYRGSAEIARAERKVVSTKH
jgi:hypothetical protein